MTYKFNRYDFEVFFTQFYLLPTIIIGTQMELLDNNFNVQFHWLCFHFRWRWIRK